jgi:hypothetical protein
MDWPLVSTIYLTSLLLLSCQFTAQSAISGQVRATTGPFRWQAEANIDHEALGYFNLGTLSGYKPPKDIGRPRRTGPSGGRIA